MQSNDRPLKGQHTKGVPRRASIHNWWAQLTSEDGWFGRRIRDERIAASSGCTALWIKAVCVIGGGALVFFTLRVIVITVIGWAHALPWTIPVADDPTGLLVTIDQPVRHYFATHTQTLPVTATWAYGVWQAVGVVSCVLGFFHYCGARLTWTVWGAATVAMAWIGTPEPGRQVAVGVTVLVWVALSFLALRGIRLTPTAFVHVDVHHQAPPVAEIRAEIHLHQTARPSYKRYKPQQPPSLN